VEPLSHPRSDALKNVGRAVPSLLCVTMLSVLDAGGQNRVPPATLAGVWGSEHTFSRGPEGPLLIDGRSSFWLAHLGGFVIPVERHESSVSFVLPLDQGRFEGEISPDGRIIQGHWVQPTKVVAGYPFSTAVQLNELVGQRAWLGTVLPLHDRLTLYLVVRASPDGSTMAFIRSPESNFGAHRLFRIEGHGTEVRLVNINQEDDEIRGSYDLGTDRLFLSIPKNINGARCPVAFDFARKTRDNAIGFYPRTPAATHFDYRPPVSKPDGWTTGSLQDVGLAIKPIAVAMDKLLSETTVGSRIQKRAAANDVTDSSEKIETRHTTALEAALARRVLELKARPPAIGDWEADFSRTPNRDASFLTLGGLEGIHISLPGQEEFQKGLPLEFTRLGKA